MQKDIDLRITPEQASDIEKVRRIYSSQTSIPLRDINSVRILRRSIDARQRNIFVNLKVRGYINEEQNDPDFQTTYYPNVKHCPQAIVVGAGPAGLFAALRLIELGIRPIVVERGKNVRDRKRDTALMNRE
ncbi:MAG: FAD-dependent monooxygenase, partial [Dysgonomonas mossii]|nr:FAD-dependent monooxygenase [Dysgonomonas mossii]